MKRKIKNPAMALSNSKAALGHWDCFCRQIWAARNFCRTPKTWSPLTILGVNANFLTKDISPGVSDIEEESAGSEDVCRMFLLFFVHPYTPMISPACFLPVSILKSARPLVAAVGLSHSWKASLRLTDEGHELRNNLSFFVFSFSAEEARLSGWHIQGGS